MAPELHAPWVGAMISQERASAGTRGPGGRIAAVVVAVLLSACAASVVDRPPGHHAADPRGTMTEQPSPAPQLTPTTLPARFLGKVWPFTGRFAAKLRRTTWHPGCPVPRRDLRLLT